MKQNKVPWGFVCVSGVTVLLSAFAFYCVCSQKLFCAPATTRGAALWMERRITCNADDAHSGRTWDAAIQQSALERNVTRREMRIKCIKHFMFHVQEAALMLALEPVSHSVLQRCPKLGFLFKRGRKKKRILVFRLDCRFPVKNVRPASTGCSSSIYDSRRQHTKLPMWKLMMCTSWTKYWE